MTRIALAVLASVALGSAVGCSDTHYRVSIRFDPASLADDAVSVAVHLAPSCPGAADLGTAPAEAIRSLVVRRGDPPPALGTVDGGRYGLQAIARAGDCTVVAAGCTPVHLDNGEGGTLNVVLRVATGPSCAPGQSCFGGTCIVAERDAGLDAAAPTDSGVDASVSHDAGLDAAIPTDAGIDASTQLTCDELYGSANEYVLCEEAADQCTFHVHPLNNAGCDTVCLLRGGACISASRDDASCEPGVALSCQQHATDEVCVCTRP